MTADPITRAPILDVDTRIRSLERLLRRKTLEIEFLQEELRDARTRRCAQAHRVLNKQADTSRNVTDVTRFPPAEILL